MALFIALFMVGIVVAFDAVLWWWNRVYKQLYYSTAVEPSIAAR
jgi:hypothetical protein